MPAAFGAVDRNLNFPLYVMERGQRSDLLTAKRLHNTRLQLQNTEHGSRDPQRVINNENR